MAEKFGRLMAIFALSGFAGLVYQSLWTQYLGLVLGHAAYAQALVLAIFMGGLALGSWLASTRRLRALPNALLAYALVEATIGVFGLAFHSGFLAYTQFSETVALPALAQASTAHAYRWTTAALLILPQCVLLGMSFPLMASACLRRDGDAQARVLGGLYFSNSAGAALGALLATFLLLPAIGMPGAMRVAGAANLLVATLAWAMSRAMAPTAATPAPAAVAVSAGPSRLLLVVLGAAALTGATSFVYEVVWVRMLNLALGTTLHSFELMLAAFILGLAAGAWWIHRRGARIGNALWLAGLAQVLMGLCALLSALAFAQSFHLVHWLMGVLPRTDAGYDQFNLASAAIALAVMFPAAFFAGSTLPLFTMALLRGGEGERAIGRVYAANTLGAIVGVFAVVHLLIPRLGLHPSLLLAALLDIGLGLALLAWFGAARGRHDALAGACAGLAMFLAVLLVGPADPLLRTSGVYRSGRFLDPEEMRLLYLRDGKTATVSVFETRDGSYRTIASNGKPEAGMAPLATQAAAGDEVTMLLVAALPLAMHPDPREVAIVGWGSGLTTHTMLGSARLQRLETIEIEPAMVEGAQAFGPRVARAYLDPRSAIVYDDARTFLATGNRHYDVLVSEPSNPWVSGVASLFTQEFYGFAGRHLKRGGLFVQWVQSYEMSDALLARISAALLQRFRYVDVYLAESTDLVFVASDAPLPPVDASRVAGGELGAELTRVGLDDTDAFTLRRLGGRRVLAAFVRMNEGQAGHSDYYPEVALRAPRDRFTDRKAGQLLLFASSGLPVLDVVDGRRLPRLQQLALWDNASSLVRYQVFSGVVAAAFHSEGARMMLLREHAPAAQAVAYLQAVSRMPVARRDLPDWSRALAMVARYGPGALAPEDGSELWISPSWLAAGQGPEVEAVMAAYRAAAQRNTGAMRTRAEAVLKLDAGLAPELREQMLVIAMTGAAGQHDRGAMVALDRSYGASLPSDDRYAQLRRFLLALDE